MISLFLVLLFPWQSLSESCKSSPYSIPGFKIHGHGIKTVSRSTRSQCEHQCAAQQGCSSISFHQNKGKCELHDGNHVSNPEMLLPGDGYNYVNFPARPPKTCSRKLCSYPLACVPKGNSYKCVTCEEAKAEQVLNFPRKSAQDYAFLDGPFVSLSAFTLSLWVQLDSSSTSYSVMHYGAATSIYATNTYIGVSVNSQHQSLQNINLADSKWHHFCLTWENTGGHIKFYIDGAVRIAFTGNQGQMLSSGYVELGYGPRTGSGTQDWKALMGNLTSVNMWSRVFSSQEVLVLASICPTSEGDVVQWSTLKTKGVGMAKLVCSNFCM